MGKPSLAGSKPRQELDAAKAIREKEQKEERLLNSPTSPWPERT